jgi:hypothetical protein
MCPTVDLLIPMAELTDEEGAYYGLYETSAFVVKDIFLSERGEGTLLNTNHVLLDVIQGFESKKPLSNGEKYIVLFKKAIFPRRELYSDNQSILIQVSLTLHSNQFNI